MILKKTADNRIREFNSSIYDTKTLLTWALFFLFWIIFWFFFNLVEKHLMCFYVIWVLGIYVCYKSIVKLLELENMVTLPCYTLNKLINLSYKFKKLTIKCQWALSFFKHFSENFNFCRSRTQPSSFLKELAPFANNSQLLSLYKILDILANMHFTGS